MNINFDPLIGFFYSNKSPQNRSARRSIRNSVPCVVLLLMFSATACTKYMSRDDLPAPLTNETFGEQVKIITVPLPVIATSPNEGITVGALSAFLFHNKNDEVSTLVAPQLNYNDNFGVTGSLYGAIYPRSDRSWELNLSRSARVNENYEIRFIDRRFSQKTELDVFVYFFTDGSARFFGFQSDSRQQDETNYGDEEAGVTINAGYHLSEKIQFVFGERLRKVSIVQGAVKGVPFIRDLYDPLEVPGINGFFSHAQMFGLQFSNLDSRTFPTSGSFARITAGFSSKALGSSENYRHYDIEAKDYISFKDGRFITVIRGAYNQTLGMNVPFLERSILGGENTLRAYGRNRFIDSSYLLFNFEERIRLFRWSVFEVNADWELAPFIDVGTVVESILKTSSQNIKFNPGVGFRAVVRPNIVGRLDLGFGEEGIAVFVGLGYPF